MSDAAANPELDLALEKADELQTATDQLHAVFAKARATSPTALVPFDVVRPIIERMDRARAEFDAAIRAMYVGKAAQ